jgi:hypothetical protein
MKRAMLHAAASALILSPAVAQACAMAAPLSTQDIKYADVVVIGHVENYEIVKDMAFRESMLSNPNLPENLRDIYADESHSLLGDYARFEVLVDKVLVGDVPDRFSATWDNSTFGEPETLPSGPFLLGFRRAGSAMPPLRGPSATVLPNPEPQSLSILQAPCAPAFIFSSSSEAAREVEAILAARP